MTKKIIAAVAIGVCLAVGNVQANDSKFALTGKLGTLGAGLDLTYDISPKINARFNLNGGSADADGVEDGVNYKGSLDLMTAGGLVDYHPTGGGFRLSVGLYNNRNEISSQADGGNNNVLIGNRAYDLTGTLDSDIAFKSTAPYVGLGWGNSVGAKKRLSFSLDAGVLFQGSPEATLKGSGNAVDRLTGTTIDMSNEPTFLAEVQTEQDNLNEEMKDYEYYPVISAGMSYKF